MRPLRRALVLGVATATTLMATACGGASTTDARDISTVATALATLPPTTAAPTTLPPSTTAVPTTTAAPPTTVATTTTTPAPETTPVVLPVPEPVPPPNDVEPVIELGTIEIPKIGVSKPMFEGITLPTLDNGPGHWPGTAAPGQVGNVVVGGHRVSHDKPFENIDQLVAGDEVIFSDTAGRHLYRVANVEIVGNDAIWIIDQTEAKTATLFACHPKGSTKQRIVAHLEYVETTV